MNIVWPLIALDFSVLGLIAYFVAGFRGRRGAPKEEPSLPDRIERPERR